MSDARYANRMRLVILLALTGALALGSFWVLEVIRRGAVEEVKSVARTDPDYYVEQFNFVSMTQTGDVQYHVSGKRLVHYPYNDTHEVQNPVVNSFGNGKPPMNARADRALVDYNMSKIHLYDNVHIDRPATSSTDPFHMSSDYLLLLTDDDVMETPKPVKITLGTSTLTGTGMYANNATRELRLAERVKAQFLAAPKSSGR